MPRRAADDSLGHLIQASQLGQLRINLDGEHYEAAQRLRRRYEDDMRLLDDLGWEPEPEL